MKTHENEVLLVFRSADGTILPTAEYNQLGNWINAGFGTPAHAEALQIQVRRQAAVL